MLQNAVDFNQPSSEIHSDALLLRKAFRAALLRRGDGPSALEEHSVGRRLCHGGREGRLLAWAAGRGNPHLVVFDSDGLAGWTDLGRAIDWLPEGGAEPSLRPPKRRRSSKSSLAVVGATPGESWGKAVPRRGRPEGSGGAQRGRRSSRN
jgi:hypothetical protein